MGKNPLNKIHLGKRWDFYEKIVEELVSYPGEENNYRNLSIDDYMQEIKCVVKRVSWVFVDL